VAERKGRREQIPRGAVDRVHKQDLRFGVGGSTGEAHPIAQPALERRLITAVYPTIRGGRCGHPS
jgi:hypothetical protein